MPDSHRAAVRRHLSPRGQRGEEGGPQAAADNRRTATPVTGAGRGGQRGGSRVWWGMDSNRKAACATAKVVGRRTGVGGGAQVWRGPESHREWASYARRNHDEAGFQRTWGTVGCDLCGQGGVARAERAAPLLARLKRGGASATTSHFMVSRHRRESSPPMASTNDNKHPTLHPSRPPTPTHPAACRMTRPGPRPLAGQEVDGALGDADDVSHPGSDRWRCWCWLGS